jgi:hypothetical protein
VLKGSEERGHEIKKKEREEGMKAEMNGGEAGKKKGRGGGTSMKMGDMEKIQGRDGKGRRM